MGSTIQNSLIFYQLPKNAKIKIDDKIYTYIKTDGMYAQLLTEDGKIAFIFAGLELTIEDEYSDYYVLKEKDK